GGSSLVPPPHFGAASSTGDGVERLPMRRDEDLETGVVGPPADRALRHGRLTYSAGGGRYLRQNPHFAACLTHSGGLRYHSVPVGRGTAPASLCHARPESGSSMPTVNQLVRKGRVAPKRDVKTPALRGEPQNRGV